MLTAAGLTWNRACTGQASPQLREGDAALSAMLLFHGLAMNGGVCHAVECLTPVDLDAAIQGYRFYGLDEIVPMVEAAQNMPTDVDDAGELEGRLDREYAARISDGDAGLVRRFEEHFAAHPEQYAPLGG